MRTTLRKLLALALLAAASLQPSASAGELWLSPSGSDAADGSAARPVATPARAAELVRRLRAEAPADSVTVRILPGTYALDATLALGAADSGAAAAPVLWRAEQAGSVLWTGARVLPDSAWKPVTDAAVRATLSPEARTQVRVLDLAAAGVRSRSAPPDHARDTVDLFVLLHEGRRLPVARWPNGELGYTTMERVVHSGSFAARSKDGGVFVYRGDRPARWKAAAEQGRLWLRGFWRVPWVAETLRVSEIDTTARTLRFSVSTPNGIGSKYSKLVDGTRIGDGKEAWYAWNLLEELDQPGEWALDARAGLLYVWPPEPGARLSVSDDPGPILALDGASHLVFEGLTFGREMGDAVTVKDGESVLLAGCTVASVGRRGVVLRGGRNHRVQSCDFREIGLSAIDLLGGDRPTLTPSGHQIVNNHLERIALAAPVPALTAGLDTRTQQLVGARIAHNRIHDASYGGITFAGNDNVLENNEVYRVGLDGGDLGGFYTTGGWTSRGNIVRRNFVHHAENANAFYMDDGSSGITLEDNLVFRTATGVFIGGGHDHRATRNWLVECTHAIHADDRGVARKYTADDPRLRKDLDSVPWRGALWSARYPELARILDSDPSVPHGNLLTGNIAVGCVNLARRGLRPENAAGVRLEDSIELRSSAVFRAPRRLDFGAASPLPLLPGQLSPEQIVAGAGLQLDAYRTSLPPRDLELLRTGDTKRRTFDSQKDVDAY